jgi:flagellar biosynthetic protein FliR
MLSVTSAQLNAWLGAFIWPFVRILALLATAPVLGQNAVPSRVKIGLAALLALLVAPTLGALPDVSVGSAAGLWILAQQVLIGVAISFVMQVVFAALEGTGEYVGLQMGLSFANLITPGSDGSTLALANFYNIIGTLAFLAIDGHLQVLVALTNTFASLPISSTPLAAPGWQVLAGWGATIFSAGLMLSLPLVAALLIANLALGILNRAAPQVGVFQIGFAVTLLIGYMVLELVLPTMMPFLTRLFDAGFGTIQQFVTMAGGG